MASNDLPIQFADDDGEGSFSFRRLLSLLYEKREYIITILKEDEPAVRKGLSSLKGRDALKLKKEGLEPGEEVLGYFSQESKTHKGHVDLHITLGERKGVKVAALKLPDDEL